MRNHGYQRVRIGDLIEGIEAGVSVRSFDEPACLGEKGVLKTSALSGGRFNPAANKRIREEDLRRAAVNPTDGCTLISRMNTSNLVGESALVVGSYPDLYLPDRIWQVHPDRNTVDPFWFSMVIAGPGVRRRLRLAASGTSGSMKNVSQAALKRIEIRVPALERQKQLAKLATFLLATMCEVQQLLSATHELKRGLMHELLTGRRRFPGPGSTEWVEMPLGALFEERNETGLDSHRLLAVTGDRGIIPRDQLNRRDTSNPDKSKYKHVCPGDIAYNTMRMWQGVSGLSEYEGIVSPAYTVVVPRGPLMGNYAKHLFKLPRVVHTFWRHSQGLVDDTLALKFPNFTKVRVCYPVDIDEQTHIANVLDMLDRQILLLESLRNAYEMYKHGLVRRLLSGDMPVPPTSASEPELAHA